MTCQPSSETAMLTARLAHRWHCCRHMASTSGAVAVTSTAAASRIQRERTPLEKEERMAVRERAKQKRIRQSVTRHSRVYGWGLTATGALGIPSLIAGEGGVGSGHYIRELNTPMHIPTHMSVHKAVAGHGFTLLAANKGARLLGTGLNTNGQLGFQLNTRATEENVNKNQTWVWAMHEVTLPFDARQHRIVDLDCGRAHSVIVTKSNGVYAMGLNSHGQCGRPIIADEDYALASANVSRLAVNAVAGDERMTAVVCGLDHTLLVSDRGRVYGCGLGADRQLGGDDAVRHECIQIRGDIDGVRVVQVACKADTVLALDADGNVFGWGNNEYSQLSVEPHTTLTQPTHLPHIARATADRGKIVQVAAGGSSCMALTDRGDVFVWGYGILGDGPECTFAQLPLHLARPYFGTVHPRNPKNTNVTSIYAGVWHSACITHAQQLYTWGSNRSNVLGLGGKDGTRHDRGDQYFPFKVNFDGKPLFVSLAPDHTIATCGMHV